MEPCIVAVIQASMLEWTVQAARVLFTAIYQACRFMSNWYAYHHWLTGIYKSERGRGTKGYILGINFQKCSNTSYIFFTLNIDTKILSPRRGPCRKGPLNTPCISYDMYYVGLMYLVVPDDVQYNASSDMFYALFLANRWAGLLLYFSLQCLINISWLICV